MTNKNNDKLDNLVKDNYNKFTSESGHWYDQDGEPMYTIIGANGKERNTTLRDAKSLGLVPSVTTIIGMIAKPSLENWKIDQALKSALSLERYEDESLESFTYRRGVHGVRRPQVHVDRASPSPGWRTMSGLPSRKRATELTTEPACTIPACSLSVRTSWMAGSA